MKRITFGAGQEHGIEIGDIVGAIIGVAKIPRDAVGAIRMKSKHSFVDVQEEHAAHVVKKLNGIEFKERKLWCK